MSFAVALEMEVIEEERIKWENRKERNRIKARERRARIKLTITPEQKEAERVKTRAYVNKKRAENRERTRAKRRHYWANRKLETKIKDAATCKAYYEANKPVKGTPEYIEHLAKEAARRDKNREENNRKDRERRKKLSPEKKAERTRQKIAAHEKKRKTDLFFRMLCNVRSRFAILIRGFVKQKRPNVKSFVKYFGCTAEEFKEYIENKFSAGMTWENHGKIWHLDHIVPLFLGGGDYELLLKLNHYKNLQPLLAPENLSKGHSIPEIWPEGVPFTREELGLPSVPCPSPVSVLPVLVSV